jgi:alpha-L-fucosidase 2
MVEMLLQSHLSYIHILPALPSRLPQGRISGVCARGGFELSFQWENGELSALEVLSKSGKECRLKYKDHSITFPTIAGKIYRFDGSLSNTSLNAG